MTNHEDSLSEKEYDFKLTEAEYQLIVQALLELPGKYTYSLVKKIESCMVEYKKS